MRARYTDDASIIFDKQVLSVHTVHVDWIASDGVGVQKYVATKCVIRDVSVSEPASSLVVVVVVAVACYQLYEKNV